MADIDLGGYTGISFNIIGTSYLNAFTGVFDGNGHTISNFGYSSAGTNYIGLFGYVDDVNAEIKDVGLIDPNVDAGIGDHVGSLVGVLLRGSVSDCNSAGGSVSGDLSVGGLVGFNGGTMSNCYATGDVNGVTEVGGLVGYHRGTVSNSYATGSVSGNDWVGGLVGENFDGTVSNCYATGSVSGNGYVGGLVGGKAYGTVSSSYATGSVSGGYDVGGLVGINYGVVSNSYATGNVSGDSRVGGLVGRNNDGMVSNSYSTGSVSGGGAIGGLVGENFDGTVSNCYAAGDVNGVTNVGGLVGYHYSCSYTKSFWDNTINPDVNGIGDGADPNVIAESTVNMQTASTFVDAGWDFTTPVWTLFCDGMNYPKLAWQIIPLGDFVCPDGVNFIDFSVIASAWGSTAGDENWDLLVDISDPNDGVINGNDLDVFVNNWLTGF